MRIVVDTNIVFSALLNADSRIARIILQPRSGLNFYSTHHLLTEIESHREKLRQLAGYTQEQYDDVFAQISNRIKILDVRLIPVALMKNALHLTRDVDVDDTEFIALTDHIKGKLWSGDKALISGMQAKGWDKFILSKDLLEIV
ncbi:MAG: PIN domain-containing protein [Imperialibacter sp.]|uniref:PIN domain-containing protein n=1 Tax=Imperialibacter sp. TaxID=2038411 RepID=UPI0032EE5967